MFNVKLIPTGIFPCWNIFQFLENVNDRKDAARLKPTKQYNSCFNDYFITKKKKQIMHRNDL